jgi:hypothetical protein
MARRSYRNWPHRQGLLVGVLLLLLSAALAHAQFPGPATGAAPASEPVPGPGDESTGPQSPPDPTTPILPSDAAIAPPFVASDPPVSPTTFSFGYNEGFTISPLDPDETPFSLKINSQNQVRYVGFVRGVKTWTDSAGTVNPVTNRNNFELPRGRLIFSGMALVPNLTYYLNIDYNTVTNSSINFRGYWLGYKFSNALELFVGQNKVPGSREWLGSSMTTLGMDRSLATTFFRPSLSQGIWITGEPVEGFHYHAMLCNGFNTLGTDPTQLDSRLAISSSLWWEPLGEFGRTYSDLEAHDDPVIRYGTSLTYSPERGQQGNPDAPENADIRLSDGTLLTDTGAITPGVTLQAYTIGLAAFDFAFKYRGWSASAEFYLRDLFSLVGNAPLTRNSIFDLGGFVQGGYFLIPQQFEMYARTSQVTGPFGAGGEYAAGMNWFFLPGKDSLKLTFDAAWINHSPADQNRTDYRAGDTGFLLRTQIQTWF